MKSRMVLKILKLGYNVLLSDVDIYWFKNPLPFVSSFGPAVLTAQSDEYNEKGYCSNTSTVYFQFKLSSCVVDLYSWASFCDVFLCRTDKYPSEIELWILLCPFR